MGFEIDYMPVGSGDKSGDAIALRFGNLMGQRDEQTVVVIDGGFTDSGEQLVKHVQEYYGTNKVDLVISTHPDADHASGLYSVLENLEVGVLLMHKPWDHAEDIKGLFKNGRITASGLEDKLEKSLQHASDLHELAIKKRVEVIEPFQGVTGFNSAMHILGPSKDYYQILLALFRSTPEPIKALGFLASLQTATKSAIKWINDHWDIDLLDDDEDTTSAENNTSTVVLFNIDGHKLLFTGDVGKTGLTHAIDYAESVGHSLTDLNFFDVPHHGSKRNISSKILKRVKSGISIISASKESTKHPAKKVTNALQKHGSRVFVTRGVTTRHHNDAPERGWGLAQHEPFHDTVEE